MGLYWKEEGPQAVPVLLPGKGLSVVCAYAHVQDGILFKAGQAVIPADTRSDIRKWVNSYLGIDAALFESQYLHCPSTNMNCGVDMSQHDACSEYQKSEYTDY